jgi:hypothetical protein
VALMTPKPPVGCDFRGVAQTQLHLPGIVAIEQASNAKKCGIQFQGQRPPEY